MVAIQGYLGLGCALGSVLFSALVLHKTSECRVARQYLCQSAVLMCGLAVLAFTVVNDNHHAYVMFAWIYGERVFVFRGQGLISGCRVLLRRVLLLPEDVHV